jgi:GMP synthase (glutamine-hydrolysing)
MNDRPFLILDCYYDELGSAPSIRALLGEAPSVTIRVVHEPLPQTLEGYAGVVVTGSKACLSAPEPEPWMAPLLALLRRVEATRKPLLGVCFGHQAIAAALGGPGAIRLAPLGELGWVKIRLEQPNPLFEGIEVEFTCFVSHFDEVSPGTTGLEVLASSERCAVQAFQVPGRPIWGVQFHPEMDPEESETLLRRNLERHTTLPNDPEAILAGRVDGRVLGARIFANFMRVCAASA